MWYMSYIMYINCSRNTWMFPPKPNTVSSLQPECLGCLQTLLFHREDWKAWYPTQWLSDSLSLRYLVCLWTERILQKGKREPVRKAQEWTSYGWCKSVNRLRALNPRLGCCSLGCGICSVLLHTKGRAWGMNECLHVLNRHGGHLV